MKSRFVIADGTFAVASLTASFLLASCSPRFEPSDGETSGNGGSASGAAGSSDEGGAPPVDGAAGASGETAGEGPAGDGSAGAGGVRSTNAGSAGESHTAADGGAAGERSETDATGGGAGSGAGCDPTRSPANEPCVIDETHGVFVSPFGSDEWGDGSRAQPFATLERGIAEAVATGRRVYACADGGAYTENVELDSAASGLALFGGFSCVNWSYDVARKSVIASASVTALDVVGVEGLHVEDFEFKAGAAMTAGESSVAAWIENSTLVKLVRTVIRAGDGADGANGELLPFDYPLASNLRGNSSTSGADGIVAGAKRCECQNTELFSVGGAGGPPGNLAGGAGQPDHGGGEPGPTGADSCLDKPEQLIGDGENGGDAPDASPAPGATSIGFADRDGWHPASGETGETAGPGQGGGGGASLVLSPAAPRGAASRGGGGGCGGCGGNGGGGGGGGGASIALFVADSEVVLSSSILVSAKGGAGGDGHAGQEGQAGGSRGAGVEACSGGAGGKGGRGGAGGGGAGGSSVGLIWIGAASPVFDGSYVLKGDAGRAGLGGEPGVNDGIPGVSREVLEAD